MLATATITTARTDTVSIFNFNGGTLLVQASGPLFTPLAATAMTVNVRNGGAIIDDGGNAVTIPQPLLHSNIAGDDAIDGGLTKLGNGSLTLAAANTYTGPTVVNVGTLAAGVANALPATSAVFVGTNGTPATLNVSNFSQTVSSLAIGAQGALTVSPANPLTISGSAGFAAGSTINLSGNIVAPAQLMTYGGPRSGTFSNVNYYGQPLLATDLSYNNNAVTVVSVPTLYLWAGQSGGDGLWSTAANWSNRPGPGNVAVFSAPTATQATVDLGASNVTVAGLVFNGMQSSVNITGNSGATLILDNTAMSAHATVNVAGQHAISAPLQLNSTTNVTATNASDSLTISGSISGVGGLTKAGAGALILTTPATYAGPTIIAGGVLKLGGGGTPIDVAFQSSNGYTGTGPLATNGTATWNVVANGVGSGSPIDGQTLSTLVNASGATVSGVQLACAGGSGVYTYYSPVIPLLNSYAYCFDGQPLTVTVSGLTASAYDVYCIENGDGNATGTYTVNGQTNPVGGSANTSSFVLGQNYTEFVSVIPTGGAIAVTVGGTGGADFDTAGLQFVPVYNGGLPTGTAAHRRGRRNAGPRGRQPNGGLTLRQRNRRQ